MTDGDIGSAIEGFPDDTFVSRDDDDAAHPAGESAEDRADVEEAERRLSDPDDLAVPYEQVRREMGLDAGPEEVSHG